MGWFSKKLKVQPPYDTLTVDQQRALYFLLEYFSDFSKMNFMFGSWEYADACNYVDKARWYLGLSKKDVEILRPSYQDIEQLYAVIKGIHNQKILDYMVSNCYNLVILARGENQEPAHKTLYAFWKRLGYTDGDIWAITQKYMYRTEI